MARLQSIIDGLENKKIQHDNDNYSDALRDYAIANTNRALELLVLM